MIPSSCRARRDWLVVGAGLGLAALIAWGTRGAPFVRGSHALILMSIVRQDADRLDCASAEQFDGARCAFDNANLPSGVREPLRPFSTIYQQVILVSGVFEEAHVASWLEAARAKGEDDRVVLSCDGTLLGKAATVGLRWQAAVPFKPEHDVDVARIERCKIAK